MAIYVNNTHAHIPMVFLHRMHVYNYVRIHLTCQIPPSYFCRKVSLSKPSCDST